jgi:hypothetical protein
MRFFTAAAVAVASIASLVAAQAPNPISSPTAGDVIEAGKPVTIAWNPTSGGKITLTLRSGNQNALNTDLVIVEDATNSGKYTWTPPKDLQAGKDYTIEIMPAGTAPDDTTNRNFSPRFELDSDGKGISSTGTTTDAPTSTETSTTETDEATTTETDTETTETDEPTSTTSSTRTRTTSAKPTTTSDEEEEEEKIPNSKDKSAGAKAASPIALVLCFAMAVAYFN